MTPYIQVRKVNIQSVKTLEVTSSAVDMDAMDVDVGL